MLFLVFSQPVCNYNIKTDTIIDYRDKQSYRTTLIKNQKWMAQNLNFKYQDNKESFCIFEDLDSCKIYGRHYTFKGANSNICPNGYHIPSPNDFETLIKNSGNKISGIQLKAISGFPKYYDMVVNGTDAFGFCSLPNTRRDPNGNIVLENKGNEYYWTNSKDTLEDGIRFLVGHGAYSMTSGSDPIENSFSVRCINDTIFNSFDTITVKIDTMFITDTIFKTNIIKDTVIKITNISSIKNDTIFKTKFVYDTISFKDTIKIIQIDTVYKIDTLVDTLQMCNDIERHYTEEVYPKNVLKITNDLEGLTAWVSKDEYNFKNVNDSRETNIEQFNNMVSIKIKTNFIGKYKIFVYDNSGVYANDIEVNIGNEYKYTNQTIMFSFNGKSKSGIKVSDGVYLIRVISQKENSFGNNVYKIGVKLNKG